MKIVKLPEMSEIEIIEAIKSKNLCRIGFIDGEFPYISPFQYVYLKNRMYFHFTNYGKKKRILGKNNNVCVSIEHFADDLSEYFFISMQGKLILLDDEREKEIVIKKMIENAKDNYSSSFLSAHGFDEKNGWDGFKTKDQIIYKFEKTSKTIALKSI